MMESKKNKKEKQNTKEIDDKICVNDEVVVAEVVTHNFYYIVRSDYKHYKKGEIICNKEDIDKLSDEDLNKVILVKNK